jgi:hypothetical protein
MHDKMNNFPTTIAVFKIVLKKKTTIFALGIFSGAVVVGAPFAVQLQQWKEIASMSEEIASMSEETSALKSKQIYNLERERLSLMSRMCLKDGSWTECLANKSILSAYAKSLAEESDRP